LKRATRFLKKQRVLTVMINYCRIRSFYGIWQMLVPQTAVMLVAVSFAHANHTFFLNGDSIGADSSLTDNEGGFTAVQQGALNLGQPAILVTLNGEELLTEFRVIVFGIANAEGALFFDEFDYQLDVWTKADYFAVMAPQLHLQLGQPHNIGLIPNGSTRVVPDTIFGTAGTAGNNAATYDFRFDLTQLPTSSVFSSPLAAGEWVLGFQSWHNAEHNGSLRVSASMAEDGPLPLFSRDGSDPRGILGGQDPGNISVRWGIALAAMHENYLAGDFNSDGVVDAADHVVWRKNLGEMSELNLNFHGDGSNGVDVGDYDLWRRNFGMTITAVGASAAVVAEPANAILLLAACGCLNPRKARRLKRLS
jgi:hypothetical protein